MSATMVSARRPDHPSIRRLWFEERVWPSLWFVPSLFVAVSLLVSRVVVVIDRNRDATRAPRWLLGADADGVSAFSNTVAVAMLSFAAVVFSTTLVAIQLAGGQYSPRVVRVFVRSRLTQITLGIFLATFVFAISSVVEQRGGDDPYVAAITVSIVYILVTATLFTFIIFVFGMSRLLRAQYLIERVTHDARPGLDAAFSEADARVPEPVLDGEPTVLRHQGPKVGVVQAIDVRGLAARAARQGVVVVLQVEAGEYVGIGTPIAEVWGTPGRALTARQIAGRFLLGAERTLQHDPGFVFRQLVDIAIRALSPAVNDPTTAVQSIDRVCDLLGGVVGNEDPSGWYLDAGGTARVRLREPGIARVLRLGFVEVIRYGADSPQVVRRLRAAFEVLEDVARPDVVTVVHELRALLDAATAESLPAAFRPLAGEPDGHGFG